MGAGLLSACPFLFRLGALYVVLPVSAGYDDKVWRAIGAADPGAVPGGSTTFPAQAGQMTGPNQDRRVLKSVAFVRAE